MKENKFKTLLISALVITLISCDPSEKAIPTIAASITTATSEPTPTLTPTEIPMSLFTDWPYPRHDLANTSASTDTRWRLLQQPVELWQIAAPEGYTFGSFFPVAADVDNDDRVEYLIGVTNFDTGDCWMYAINIEDGTILWKQHFHSIFYWSAPVVVDVNNDGQLDIVLATNSWHGPIQVIALNGNDASPIWVQTLPADGMGMTVADVNGDGWVEVIVNDYGDPKIVHLLNGQDGSVIWQRETGGSAYNIPAVGDIDGDGFPEIVQHNHLYQPSRERLLVWDQDGNELWTYSASPSSDQEANAPPELGWTPDYGYISTTLADFNADGEIEVGWGTRCHYYLLNGLGDLLWRVPTCEGHGVSVRHMADGAVNPDEHGTGGLPWFDYAAGVGNIDDDPALEVILPLGSEYREDRYDSTGATIYSQVMQANKLWALDGEDGTVQWVFEGNYVSKDSVDAMYEPILVDLTADGLLDVLALSSSGYLYAIHGTTGKQLMGYPVHIPGNWYAVNLTFVGDGDKGIVLFNSVQHIMETQSSTNILHAWQIAEHASSTTPILIPPTQPFFTAPVPEGAQSLLVHTDQVKSLAFSPEGTMLAVGVRDGTVVLWDMSTDERLQTLEGHTGAVRSVDFSFDGKMIAAGSESGDVIVWDAATGKRLYTLEGHTRDVSGLAFSPDGTTLTSGSWDGTVIMWNTAIGQRLRTLTEHTDWVTSVDFSPDGTTLASGSCDGTIILWDSSTGEHLRTFTGHTNKVWGVVFSPDGATLASGAWDSTIILWDVSTGERLLTFDQHPSWAGSVAFSSDGVTLASSMRGVNLWGVNLWDVSTGKLQRSLEGHTDMMECVGFSPDGTTLASGSCDGTIILWSMEP